MYQSVWILNEYERGVVFRLGRFQVVKEAGLRLVIPFVDRLLKVSLREIVMDVPPQDVITRDNVSVKVNAVVYFRVLHPEDAVIKVEDFHYGTSQLAQTTLRSICGQGELDRILSEREAINRQLQEELDRGTDPWGVKVRAVEIKHIDLPTEMQRAMAKQAEAERERRAKVIHAEGEFQASERLREASDVIWRGRPTRFSCATYRPFPTSRASRTRPSCSPSRSTSSPRSSRRAKRCPAANQIDHLRLRRSTSSIREGLEETRTLQRPRDLTPSSRAS